MDIKHKKVLDQALQLSPVERARLVDQLLSSFDSVGREALDAQWAAEVEDRIEAYDKGELHASSDEAVFRRLQESGR